MVLVLRDDAYGAGFRIRVDYSAAWQEDDYSCDVFDDGELDDNSFSV